MSAKVGQTFRRFWVVEWKARRSEESVEDKWMVVGQSRAAWEE